MNEFVLIDRFFNTIAQPRPDVVIGIGDDAACLAVPDGYQLLVSTDTLVADVHFLSSWEPYNIAYKAAMATISDIAAMGGIPSWMTLALTLPSDDEIWLQGFSLGLRDALQQYDISLIGGDTTRGSLSMTLTVLGTVPVDQAVKRSGAKSGDKIYVSGLLGAAALAVALGSHPRQFFHQSELLEEKLMRPKARVDLSACLRAYASSAIDISDGLLADLNHICVASGVGACINLDAVPVHPVVKEYAAMRTEFQARCLDFALSGGDDYELCFTIPTELEAQFLQVLREAGQTVYLIGITEAALGLRTKTSQGEIVAVNALGYSHF